jgi:CHASE3 domain sensor protein
MLDEYDLVAKIRLRWGVSFAMMIIVIIVAVVVVIQRKKMTTKLRTEVAETTGNDNSPLLLTH